MPKRHELLVGSGAAQGLRAHVHLLGWWCEDSALGGAHRKKVTRGDKLRIHITNLHIASLSDRFEWNGDRSICGVHSYTLGMRDADGA